MPDTGDALVLELEDLGRRLTAIDDDVDVVARALDQIERTERRTRTWRRVDGVRGRGRDDRAARPRDPARASRRGRSVRHRR